MALLSVKTRVLYAALLSASILCIYVGKVAQDSTTQEHGTPMKLSSILSSNEMKKKIDSSNGAVDSDTFLSSYLNGADVSDKDKRENRGGGYGFDLWMVDKHRHHTIMDGDEEKKKDGGESSFLASGGKVDAFAGKEKKDMDSNIPKEMKKGDVMFDHISSLIQKANFSHWYHVNSDEKVVGENVEDVVKDNLKNNVASTAKYFRNLIGTSKKKARAEGDDVAVARNLREDVATTTSSSFKEEKKDEKSFLEKVDSTHHHDGNVDGDGTTDGVKPIFTNPRKLEATTTGAPYFRLKESFTDGFTYNSGDDIAASDDLSVIALSSFVLDDSSDSVQNGLFLPSVTIQKLVDGEYVETNVPMNNVVASPYHSDVLTQLAVSGDGSTLAVAQVYTARGDNAALSESTVKIFKESDGIWSLLDTPYFGNAVGGGSKPGLVVSLTDNGDYLLVGERYSENKKGKVMLYSYDESSKTYSLDNSLNIVGAEVGDQAGSSVMISRDGSCFIYGSVGGNNGTGSAHVYCKDTNTGNFVLDNNNLQGTDLKSEYGFSVAITTGSNGEVVAAVGARLHDSTDKINAGLVQAYKKLSSTGLWLPLGTDIIGDRGRSIEEYHTGDEFGFSISLGNIQSDKSLRLAVGSPNVDADGGGRPNYYHGQVSLYEISDVSASNDSQDWNEIANGINGDSKDSSGSSVVLSTDGKRIAVASPNREEDVLLAVSKGIVHVYLQDEYSDAPSQVPSNNPTATVLPSFAPSISSSPSNVPSQSLHPSTEIASLVQFILSVVMDISQKDVFVPFLKVFFSILFGVPESSILIELVQPLSQDRGQLESNSYQFMATIKTRKPDGVVANMVKAQLPAATTEEFGNTIQVTGFEAIASDVPSLTPSDIPSDVPSDLPSSLPSNVPSNVPSLSPSDSPSNLPSSIPSDAPSDAPSDVPSDAPSDLPSSLPSDIPSDIPSLSPSDLPSDNPSVSPSNQPSDIPSDIPSDSPSNQPSDIPSDIPSDTPSDQPSDIPSSVPSSVPSDVPSDLPSLQPSSVPSDIPSDVPSDAPSDAPSDQPSVFPSSMPSDIPSDSPSDQPSLLPSFIPSDIPSDVPSDAPSDVPSDQPSSVPSSMPSDSPSDIPSDMPSDAPSDVPSDQPSSVPSSTPSDIPSDMPSDAPSDVPSDHPSLLPSSMPSDIPSDVPSDAPSDAPSDQPSSVPSSMPSDIPSDAPSDLPSSLPSGIPSNIPSLSPSDSPSDLPSSFPSSFTSRNFIIKSTFSDSLEDFCLTVDNAQTNGKLYIRKCQLDSEDIRKRQVWTFNEKRGVQLALTSDNYCLQSIYRQLQLFTCDGSSSVENFQFVCPDIGDVNCKKGMLKQYRTNTQKSFFIGFTENRIFERLRFFREGTVNESLNKWALVFQDSFPISSPLSDPPAQVMSPSDIPSDQPSDTPSDEPSDIPSEIPSDVPSVVGQCPECDISNFLGDNYSYFDNGYLWDIDNLGRSGSLIVQGDQGESYKIGTYSSINGQVVSYTNGDYCSVVGRNRRGAFEIVLTSDPNENGELSTSEPSICVYVFEKKCYCEVKPSSVPSMVDQPSSIPSDQPSDIPSNQPSLPPSSIPSVLDPAGYICLQTSQLTWQSSQAEATSNGANLVSIRCPEQSQRLTDLNSSDQVWVGGSDSASEGDWVFLDGGSVTYTNWGTDQPNDSNGGEDCMDFNYPSTGFWNDSPCTQTQKAIYYSTTPINGLSCMSYVVCPDTENPSQSPSNQPSSILSLIPSDIPSNKPSDQPSSLPTPVLSSSPSCSNELWSMIGDNINGEVAGDQSGNAVSLSSDSKTVAIGARHNGANGFRSGNVRVYKLDDSTSQWIQLGNGIVGKAAEDQFGYSLSLSSDGGTVAIGAPFHDGIGSDSGHVRVYKFDGISQWIQAGVDIEGEAAGDNFGYAMSLSSDGGTVAIGARKSDGIGTDSGHVRVYKFDETSQWITVGADIDGEATDDLSGRSVSLSSDGGTVAIGAYRNDGNGSNSGHVRVYKFDGISQWIKLGEDIDGEAANDQSGFSVSLSLDGTTVAIGANGNDGNGTNSGHVRVYQYDNSSWVQLGADIDGEAALDNSGYSVSLSLDGRTVAIGAYGNNANDRSDSGHVRVYQYDYSSWVQLGADIDGKAVDDWFGFSVSLSSNGRTVAIGAKHNDANGGNSGQVTVYNLC